MKKVRQGVGAPIETTINTTDYNVDCYKDFGEGFL